MTVENACAEIPLPLRPQPVRRRLTPTADEVSTIRTEMQCGLLEAKRIVNNRLLVQAIDQAVTIEDLRAILRALAERIQ